MDDATFDAMRDEMVEMISAHTLIVADITGRPVLDSSVIRAMADVPRHEFVPDEVRNFAYFDSPLPIGHDKTISQPFIVALMTDLLAPKADDTVLEIGTGLGYQAAVLSRLAGRVCTMEIIPELAEDAAARLAAYGCANVECRVGDGARGWADAAPFERIIVTAAPELVPTGLLAQLKPGGRMVLPAGLPDSQILTLVEKDADGRTRMREILPVRFSAMVLAH